MWTPPPPLKSLPAETGRLAPRVNRKPMRTMLAFVDNTRFVQLQSTVVVWEPLPTIDSGTQARAPQLSSENVPEPSVMFTEVVTKSACALATFTARDRVPHGVLLLPQHVVSFTLAETNMFRSGSHRAVTGASIAAKAAKSAAVANIAKPLS